MRPVVVLAAALAVAGCGGGETTSVPHRVVPAHTRTATTATTPTTSTTTTPTATTPTGTATTGTPPATTPTAPPTPTVSTPATTPTAPSSPTATTPAAPSAPAPAATVRACGTVVNGFVRDVRAVGVSCAEALTTARDWFRAIESGGQPGNALLAGAYSCRGSLQGELASVACSSPDGRVPVTFTASP